ncbi:PEPxxWA-CTERM sorting domain-containing protein [Phenylobacterium sp.]|jgi:hypothetical protein|uniref:PEPxxWA-CTERM sorting domain-containing protein n=1 Tax=Phenylobacterium sp. TaxID=1871053 RepID=UPI002E31AC0F|nr:PEPxxWA-CTERM sorting domain-containing protein [Phenylobacterium sp.]HEX4709445.1 PEPxxWA-CTERM sorting domain-containing protein [Phenylobacterium sp.]
MKITIAMALGALACSAALPANALIVIGTGAGTLQPPENVLFTNNPANGLTITGVTNQTATGVSISGGETLVGSGGQASVSAVDGLINTGFTFKGTANQTLGFDLTNPAQAFTSAEFRLFVGSGTATQATLTFVDTAGQQFQSTFAIPANGFFNAQATNGEQIDYFSIATNGSVEDARQIRLGGVGSISANVPEPASWALMIMGVGGIGASLRRRKSRQPKLA